MNSSEEQYMETTGFVEAICRDKFTVKITEPTEMEVICTLSGKMRVSGIKILAGDKVDIKVSIYDPSKGRITYRHKN